MLTKYGFYIVLGYLAGGMMFGYLIPRLLKGIDVRALSSDGNPGTANAFFYGGAFCGTLVLVFELMKGFLPVYFAGRTLGQKGIGFALVMAAPVLGHAFPAGRGRKKGGKGIAVSFGVLMGLHPLVSVLWLLIFWYLLYSAVIILDPHSFRTAVTYLCWLLTSVFLKPGGAVLLGNLLITGIILNKHREDLRSMEERKIRLGLGKNRG